jgi:hypothetical protein
LGGCDSHATSFSIDVLSVSQVVRQVAQRLTVHAKTVCVLFREKIAFGLASKTAPNPAIISAELRLS